MNSIDPKQTEEKIVAFLTKTFADTGFSKAVIGLSGGVDSATCCILAIRALGAAKVFPVLLPYGALSTQATIDAMTFVQGVGIPLGNIVRFDIKSAVDSLVAGDRSTDNVRRGNIMARARMTVLFDQAKKRQALVVGTENKSEHLLGYFTRFGDEASDVEPIRNLYKTQVYALAKHLSVPESILNKPPTAGLWDGQTDEGEFGFSYKDADQIMDLLYDEKKSVTDIVSLGWDKILVDKVKLRVENNAFKHTLPILPD